MQDAVEQKTIIIRSQVLESIHKAIVLCYSTGTPQTHTHASQEGGAVCKMLALSYNTHTTHTPSLEGIFVCIMLALY
jgi:hypothetical protein